MSQLRKRSRRLWAGRRHHQLMGARPPRAGGHRRPGASRMGVAPSSLGHATCRPRNRGPAAVGQEQLHPAAGVHRPAIEEVAQPTTVAGWRLLDESAAASPHAERLMGSA